MSLRVERSNLFVVTREAKQFLSVIASVTKQSIQLKQETWGITYRLPRRQKKATRNDGDFVIASGTKQSFFFVIASGTKQSLS
jgi:hypothetical protein